MATQTKDVNQETNSQTSAVDTDKALQPITDGRAQPQATMVDIVRKLQARSLDTVRSWTDRAMSDSRVLVNEVFDIIETSLAAQWQLVDGIVDDQWNIASRLVNVQSWGESGNASRR